MKKRLTILMLGIVLVLSLPMQAFAASTARLSKTAISSVEKIAAANSSSLQAKLTEQNKKVQDIEVQDENLDTEITSLHRNNGEKLFTINARLKKLNAEKLDKLKNDADEARERYKPLFALQTSLNKQLTEARKLKNKTLVEALEAQLSVVKASAVIARAEINLKDDAYTQVKEPTTKTVKAVRAVLKDLSVEQAQLRAEKKASVETGKLISAESKKLTAALKKKDASETLTALTAMATLSNQMISQKSRIITSEKKIAAILEKAAALLPV